MKGPYGTDKKIADTAGRNPSRGIFKTKGDFTGGIGA